MHGTEHCDRMCRTFRLSAPQPPSFSNDWIDALKPAAASFRPVPVARNGLSLARNGRRSHAFHSGVNVPGLLLRSLARRLPARSALPLHRPHRFAPMWAASPRQTRCRSSTSSANRCRCFHSPLGLLPPSGSKRSAASLSAGSPPDSARSPFAPRRRFLSLVARLRITVPGSLRSRWLAVPQTSWNLLQYASEPFRRQRVSCANTPISSIYFSPVSKELQSTWCEIVVDKTRPEDSVTAA